MGTRGLLQVVALEYKRSSSMAHAALGQVPKEARLRKSTVGFGANCV